MENKVVKKILDHINQNDLEKLFNKNKEKIKDEYISVSKYNLLCNDRVSFILRYLFDIKYSNYRMLFGKIAEKTFLRLFKPKLEINIDKEIEMENDLIDANDFSIRVKELENYNHYLNIVIPNLKDFFTGFDLIEYNTEYTYSINNDIKFYFLPDFILKREDQYYLIEYKYLNNISMINENHARQVLMYKQFLDIKYHNIIPYLIYTSTQTYKIYRLENDNIDLNIFNWRKVIDNFLDNITFEKAIHILKTENTKYNNQYDNIFINAIIEKYFQKFI
jgi:hypothetical protein